MSHPPADAQLADSPRGASRIRHQPSGSRTPQPNRAPPPPSAAGSSAQMLPPAELGASDEVVVAASVDHQRESGNLRLIANPRCGDRARCGPVVGRHEHRQITEVAIAIRPEVHSGLLRVIVAAGGATRNHRPVVLRGRAAITVLVHVEAMRTRRQSGEVGSEYRATVAVGDLHRAQHLAVAGFREHVHRDGHGLGRRWWIRLGSGSRCGNRGRSGGGIVVVAPAREQPGGDEGDERHGAARANPYTNIGHGRTSLKAGTRSALHGGTGCRPTRSTVRNRQPLPAG